LPLCDAKKKLSKQQAELLDRLAKRAHKPHRGDLS